jgi:RNA-directed DNA polymerase
MQKVERRIADRSLLKLIRMWLKAPVVEEQGPPTGKWSRKGTPQGGVISPLLANLYLHEMDRAFYEEKEGPFQRAKARLVRYADDFVILARYMRRPITTWVERKSEKTLGLEINRNKTRIVRMDQPGESLDFLGFTLRYDRRLWSKNSLYLNVLPSKKATARLRKHLRDKTRAEVKKPLLE